nr:reverse transcriptase domain-containing protein [Tanacetum cinerariifolium]
KARLKVRQIHPPCKNTKRNPGFGQREVQASSSNDNPVLQQIPPKGQKPDDSCNYATGRKELCGLLRRNLDIFSWKPANMTGVPRHIAEHRLNIHEGCLPIRQKKRGQAHERNKAIYKEVEKMVDADIMKEVHYHSWLSNPVMVKKHDGNWRICRSDPHFSISKVFEGRAKAKWKARNLNRFLSNSAEKSFPFFKTLKKCIRKSDFQRTAEAETAFKRMKKSITELPMLTTPKEKEELIIYPAATKEAVSAVLVTKRDGKQMPIYFVSRALQGSKINHTPMEKLIIALVNASKLLKRYFQAHTIIVITDQPIKHILSNLEVTGRLLKWSFELEEHDIHYRPKTSVKGQILANFIVERPEDDPRDTTMGDKEALSAPWILFINGSSCIDGFGVGLIITNQEGMEFTYALRFRFDATKNEAEYEALIADLRMAEQMGIKIFKQRGENKKADAVNKITSTSFAHLSKQVLVKELKEKSIDEKDVLTVVEEEGRTWMTPIHVYLVEEILPEVKKKARAIHRKANYILREIHEGSCSMHAGPRKQFRDNPFKGWCEKLCIRQCFAFFKHPQANGLVERTNMSLGKGIKAMLDERRKNWLEERSHVLWAHRTMIKSSNGETPFLLTYGTKAVIFVEIGMPTMRTTEVDMIKNNKALGINLDLLEEKIEQAAIQKAKKQSQNRKIL